MTLTEAQREIKVRGKLNTAKIYRRHGVSEPTVGLSYADIGTLVKKIGVDHALALGLWATGLHDARVVATKVVDADKLSVRVLASWLADCRNYVITDAFSSMAARVPDILPAAVRWTHRRREWTSSAGWSVIAILAMREGLDDTLAETLLARVESSIHSCPNRTRYSMNNVLIAIGGSMPSMRARAIGVARAIGPVHVDHGETGCRTPDAGETIGKMVAHRAAKRTRVKGVRVAGRKG